MERWREISSEYHCKYHRYMMLGAFQFASDRVKTQRSDASSRSAVRCGLSDQIKISVFFERGNGRVRRSRRKGSLFSDYSMTTT